MIYLRVGLFAEGPTDYHFLQGIIDQLVNEIAADLLAGGFEAAPTLGIDAPRSKGNRSREERIAAAIEASWDECTLFVVHGDGAGDPDGARQTQIEPGLAHARAARSDLAAAACVPVRETEAWILGDAGAFARLFETNRAPALPHDPEAESDPKKILREVLKGMGARVERGVTKYYADLGKEIRPAELRRLSAFRRFEEELRAAIEAVAVLRGPL
jgi:Domain of unknown function (DUF4276)